MEGSLCYLHGGLVFEGDIVRDPLLTLHVEVAEGLPLLLRALVCLDIVVKHGHGLLKLFFHGPVQNKHVLSLRLLANNSRVRHRHELPARLALRRFEEGLHLNFLVVAVVSDFFWVVSYIVALNEVIDLQLLNEVPIVEPSQLLKLGLHGLEERCQVILEGDPLAEPLHGLVTGVRRYEGKLVLKELVDPVLLEDDFIVSSFVGVVSRHNSDGMPLKQGEDPVGVGWPFFFFDLYDLHLRKISEVGFANENGLVRLGLRSIGVLLSDDELL
mmetsp:Transcript_17002/g.26209  ORF Transcript_17002/g.26209 Transcript_17002/m.26209 type:complete len:271 (-) Transcript_17002:3646-4458(-)